MDLKLEWHDRRSLGQTVGNQSPRRFLDFVVDGASIYEGHGMDFISALGWLSPDADEQVARRLLLKEGPEVEGRVALYICPECGDLYCGVISARIEREGDDFLWREMGFSSMDWSEGVWRHEQDDFDAWQELRFPASEYEEVILARPKAA